eukprot:8240987-Pyramimonas_sp.AAC.1
MVHDFVDVGALVRVEAQHRLEQILKLGAEVLLNSLVELEGVGLLLPIDNAHRTAHTSAHTLHSAGSALLANVRSTRCRCAPSFDSRAFGPC